MTDTHQNPKLLNGVVTIAAVAAFLVWGVTALTNEDPLWFIRSFDAQAETLTIYWEGESYILTPGEHAYEPIMQAFAEGITDPAGYEGKVGLSETTITEYRERFRLLEIQFDEPVQVHTRHPYPEARTYLIPLNRTHGQYRRAFSFTGIVPYTSGPLTMQEAHFSELYKAVESAVAERRSRVQATE